MYNEHRPKFGLKMAQIWPNIDFLSGPWPGPAQSRKIQARSRPKSQVLKTAQALGWSKEDRPKADLGQCPLGHLWAWANLGPSWYIGPGRFGLGRARPKPIPNAN